jgi:type IV pilus assembly protein PilP
MRTLALQLFRRGVLVGLAALLLVACEDDSTPRSAGRGSSTAPGGAKTVGGGADPAAAAPPEEITVSYTDDDFVESERNRDPFRSYVTEFKAKSVAEVQRQVVMPSTAIEEMKLIAIITGTAQPKAMLVDPLGVGYVVERGVYVGRPQVIQATGSVSMTLNWRVDRIRDNEVVLTRQDPTDPTRPPLTRIIPLHTDDEVARR